jgi:CRISPR-associated protein Csd1
MGDATTVFWADKENAKDFENSFASFFGMAPKDNPDRDIDAVKKLNDGIWTGKGASSEKTRFFVLGLTPNSARLSIRFWQTGTVASFAQRLEQHFKDLEILRSPKDTHLGLAYLLADISLENKIDNLPPKLSGDMVRAVLEGLPYPATLLNQTIQRIRATQKINGIRAALLKGYLNRKYRNNHPTKEMTVSLDPENKSPSYLLGRLFACLEKIQVDAAQHELNTTIRDRYYGAFSATPVVVFAQLMKLKNFHLAKLKPDGKNHGPKYFERLLGEIVGFLPPKIPSHLSLEEQAEFAIGYYHQRQDFFTKKSNPEPSTQEQT